jgi:hypothetical protein
MRRSSTILTGERVVSLVRVTTTAVLSSCRSCRRCSLGATVEKTLPRAVQLVIPSKKCVGLGPRRTKKPSLETRVLDEHRAPAVVVEARMQVGCLNGLVYGASVVLLGRY